MLMKSWSEMWSGTGVVVACRMASGSFVNTRSSVFSSLVDLFITWTILCLFTIFMSSLNARCSWNLRSGLWMGMVVPSCVSHLTFGPGKLKSPRSNMFELLLPLLKHVEHSHAFG